MQTLSEKQNMERNPKVLVGCPTSDHKGYCVKRYMAGLKKLTYNNFDILIVDNSKGEEYTKEISSLGLPVIKGPYSESARQRIIDSRNLLRKKVLDEGYDYFLSLEQDVIPPVDFIEKLLVQDKKVIGGLYFNYNNIQEKDVLMPLIWKRVGEDEVRYFSLEEVKEGVMDVGATGLGCLLIHRDVLKDIKFRFKVMEKGFDDMWFCQDVFRKGYKIYIDTSLKCKHLIKGWCWEGIKQ